MEQRKIEHVCKMLIRRLENETSELKEQNLNHFMAIADQFPHKVIHLKNLAACSYEISLNDFSFVFLSHLSNDIDKLDDIYTGIYLNPSKSDNVNDYFELCFGLDGDNTEFDKLEKVIRMKHFRLV